MIGHRANSHVTQKVVTSLVFFPVGAVISLAPGVVLPPSVFTCSSSSDTLPDTSVYGDAARPYCKLQGHVDANYMHQMLIWHCVDEDFGGNIHELNTAHSYIAGEPNAPAVHFKFRRLMPFLHFEGIIATFEDTKYDHKSLVTGWASFSKRQYKRTFQRRHPTCEQIVQEGCILEDAQFCFGYREEEGGFNTYWAKVIRLNWVRNKVSTPRKPSKFDWTITLVLDYCLTVAFF
jgi:hypothetical protein